MAHQPLDAFATDGDSVGAQVAIDPWRAVGATARDVQLPDPLQQRLIAELRAATVAALAQAWKPERLTPSTRQSVLTGW